MLRYWPILFFLSLSIACTSKQGTSESKCSSKLFESHNCPPNTVFINKDTGVKLKGKVLAIVPLAFMGHGYSPRKSEAALFRSLIKIYFLKSNINVIPVNQFDKIIFKLSDEMRKQGKSGKDVIFTASNMVGADYVLTGQAMYPGKTAIKPVTKSFLWLYNVKTKKKEIEIVLVNGTLSTSEWAKLYIQKMSLRDN